jgi:IS30 family transposase
MKHKSYRRLTLTDRCHIQDGFQSRKSYQEIGQFIGFHRTTVYREVRRNLYGSYKNYRKDRAQERANNLKALCHKKYRIKCAIEDYVIAKLKQYWSPEQISARLEMDTIFKVSIQCIYDFIKKRAKHLKVYLRRKRNYGWGRFTQRKRKKFGDKLHIFQRPASVLKRNRYGHWERDTLYAKNGEKVLVCVERKTRLTKLVKIDTLKAKTITELTIECLKKAKLPIESMTNDNGSEFSDAKNLGVDCYFCSPFKPQQRGTVENTIGLIRTFISRKTDISQFNEQTMQEIEDQLNNRPRKCLNFKTPLEAARKKMLH